MAAALDTSPRTVFRIKGRYAEEGLDGVLYDHPQAYRYRKLDDRGEAHPVSSTGQALIALACSDAPEGHDHWTLRLLADKVVELGLVDSLSYETVRLRLKKHPGVRWCASTRPPPPPQADWRMSENPCRLSRAGPGARTTSTAVVALATSSCSVNHWPAGACGP